MTVDLGAYGDPDAVAPWRPRRLRRSGRRPRVHPLLGAVVLLLAADGVALAGRTHADAGVGADPGRVAIAFLTAVGDGDGGAARSYLAVLPTGESRLTDADLRSQVGPAFPVVGAVVRHGDRADVTITYDVVGLPATSYLHLVDDHHGLLGASRWRIAGGLPVLRVGVTGRRPPTVDGRATTATDGTVEITMFPGLAKVGDEAVPVTGDAVLVQDSR